MMPGSSTLVKIGAIVVGAILLVAAVVLYGNARYHNGVADTDAKWAAASARMQAATAKAMNAANRIAAAQEAKDAAEIKELKDEAAKGNDSTVGPGTRAVLERLRDQARR